MKRLAPLLFLICPFIASAQMSMSTLQDLPTVAIRVRAITPDGIKFGLTNEDLIQVVSDGLKIAGVKVVPPEEEANVAEVPTIEITAIVTKLGEAGHIYGLRLALREVVELKRKAGNLVEIGAITWERETQGYTSEKDRIISSAASLTDRFVIEWKRGN